MYIILNPSKSFCAFSVYVIKSLDQPCWIVYWKLWIWKRLPNLVVFLQYREMFKSVVESCILSSYQIIILLPNMHRNTEIWTFQKRKEEILACIKHYLLPFSACFKYFVIILRIVQINCLQRPSMYFGIDFVMTRVLFKVNSLLINWLKVSTNNTLKISFRNLLKHQTY